MNTQVLKFLATTALLASLLIIVFFFFSLDVSKNHFSFRAKEVNAQFGEGVRGVYMDLDLASGGNGIRYVAQENIDFPGFPDPGFDDVLNTRIGRVDDASAYYRGSINLPVSGTYNFRVDVGDDNHVTTELRVGYSKVLPKCDELADGTKVNCGGDRSASKNFNEDGWQHFSFLIRVRDNTPDSEVRLYWTKPDSACGGVPCAEEIIPANVLDPQWWTTSVVTIPSLEKPPARVNFVAAGVGSNGIAIPSIEIDMPPTTLTDEVLLIWTYSREESITVTNNYTGRSESMDGTQVTNAHGNKWNGMFLTLPSSLITADTNRKLRLSFDTDWSNLNSVNGFSLIVPYIDPAQPVGRLPIYVDGVHLYREMSRVFVFPVDPSVMDIDNIQPVFIFGNGETEQQTLIEDYRPNYVVMLSGSGLPPSEGAWLEDMEGSEIILPQSSPLAGNLTDPAFWYPAYGREGAEIDVISPNYVINEWSDAEAERSGGGYMPPLSIAPTDTWVAFQWYSSQYVEDGLITDDGESGTFVAGGIFSTLLPADVEVPDLTIVGNGNMQVPVGLTAGDTAKFQANVLNQGTNDVVGSFDNLYQVYVNYNAGAGTWDYIENIEAPGSITDLAVSLSKTTSLSNEWTTVAGSHGVRVCADLPPNPNGVITESIDGEFGNNCGAIFSPFVVASAGPIALDLVSSQPWISTGGATPVQDSTVKFRGDVTNQGTDNTSPGGFLNRFRVYINYNPVAGTFDSIINLDGGGAINGKLKAGNTKTTQESPPWTALWTPTINRHAVQLCADIPDNWIPEGVGEGNNCGPLLVFNTQPAPPVPTIIQSIPATDQGDPYDIWWGSTYASSCDVTKQGPIGGPLPWQSGPSGGPITETDFPIGDYIYENTCTGPGGTQSAMLTHTVNPPSPPEAFITQSISFTNQGDPVTITWWSNFADTCTIAERFNDGTGWSLWADVVWASGLSGNKTINPIAIGQYEWRNFCTNSIGDNTKKTTPPHDVEAKPPLFDITLPDLTPFTAINEGDDIRIRWTCYYSLFGAAPYSTGTLFSTGGAITDDITEMGPALPGSYDYQLDCKNTGFKQQTVTVREPTLDFSATPSLIQPEGDSNIEWNISGVNSCSISGPNGFSFSSGDISGGDIWSDIQTVTNIVEQSVYTLTCQTNIRTIEKVVTVNINPTYQEL